MKNIIKILWCGLLFLATLNTSYGQVPQINSIDKRTTFAGDIMVISGSDFSNNPSELIVWFGAVRGNVVASTTSLIEVEVPPQAYFSTVSVTNLISGKTGLSRRKFFTSFNGDVPFDETKFTDPQIYSEQTYSEYYSLCNCDLDRDGKPDIIATKFKDVSQGRDLLVLKNESTPENLVFTALTGTTTPSLRLDISSLDIQCADLNGDGKPDLAMTRSEINRNNFYVIQNNTPQGGSITFGPKQVYPMGTNPDEKSTRLAIADLDFDGLPEIVVTNIQNNKIFIYKNRSTKTTVAFNPTPTIVTIEGVEKTNGIEILDLNNDRLPELIITQHTGRNIYILPNQSSGTTLSFGTPIVRESDSKTLVNVKLVDLDGDGREDIVATQTPGTQIAVFKNITESAIAFADPVFFNTGNDPWDINVADMNGDKKPDVIVTNTAAEQINILLNTSTNGTISLTQHNIPTTYRSRSVVAGDFDGDGKPDIAYTAFSGQSGPFRVEIIRNMNCFVPQILNESPLSICPGQVITLNSIENSSATASWTKDGVAAGTGYSLDITGLGEYVITAISESGACVESDNITIGDGQDDVPDPVITAPSSICEGEEMVFSVQDFAGANYYWDVPYQDEPVVTSTNQLTIAEVEAEMAGNYHVKYKLESNCESRPATQNLEVYVLPVFTVSPANSAACGTSGTTLTVTNNGGGYTYQWLKDGVEIGDAIGLTYNATTSGSYTVRVTDDVTNCSIITESAVFTAYDEPNAEFSLSAASVCTEETITITNTSTVDADITPSYQWDFGNGTTSDAVEPTISYTGAGNFNISLTISYPGISGCTSNIQLPVTVNEATIPQITASVTEICPEEHVTLSVSGDYQTVSWSNGAEGNEIMSDEAGIYTVATQDQNGCPGEDEIEIFAKPVPVVTASADPLSINAGEEVTLTATGADTYLWNPQAIVEDPTAEVTIGRPVTDTTFIVVGTLIDGCKDSAEVKVTVITGSELPINPAKVFSPQSTINPTWDIEFSFSNESCNLAIFDERGSKLIENEAPSDNFFFQWDGTLSGNPLPEGVYYYVVGCTDGRRKAGSVLVVRQ